MRLGDFLIQGNGTTGSAASRFDEANTAATGLRRGLSVARDVYTDVYLIRALRLGWSHERPESDGSWVRL